MQNIPLSGSVVKEVMDRGHSGTIYLPKAWIGQRVVVQPLNVREYVLGVLSPYLEDVSGVFLYGSYVRGEESGGSDIDVLIVSEKEIPVHKEGLVNIESGSLEEIRQRLKKDPVGYYSIVQECIPVINAPLLKDLKAIEPDDRNLSAYYELTESVLKVSEHILNVKDSDHSGAIRSLVLRLRGLYILRCRMRKEQYTSRGLKEYVIGKGIDSDVFDEIYAVYKAATEERPIPVHRIPTKALRRLHDIDLQLLNELKDESQKKTKKGH